MNDLAYILFLVLLGLTLLIVSIPRLNNLAHGNHTTKPLPSFIIVIAIVTGVALVIALILQLNNLTSDRLSWFIVFLGLVMFLIVGWIYFNDR